MKLPIYKNIERVPSFPSITIDGKYAYLWWRDKSIKGMVWIGKKTEKEVVGKLKEIALNLSRGKDVK